MELKVREVEFFLSDCHTRIPFRFGVITFTGAPHCLARVEIETEDGRVATGLAADFLVPKWFDKDPSRSMACNMVDLLESARESRRRWLAAGSGTAFELWHAVYRERVSSTPEDAPDRLVRGYGVALIERALIDATCRAAGRSFAAALREDLLGVRPGAVHPELAGWTTAGCLPAAPLREIVARHTVGLVDELRVAEIPDAERVEDGFPQALEEDVARYGLDCFKLKVGGDPSADERRLLAIAGVLDETVQGRWTCTLDGNEQYADLADLRRLLEGLRAHESGRRLLEGLLCIEQPLPRASSFEPRFREELAALDALAPVILDEADHGVEAFPRGLDLGYRGVSVKNCKGVFRAIVNRALCDVRGGGAFQSGEDLTNLGVLSLQQDLATMAVLGIEHVERNGHHYFRGLDHLPRTEAQAALAAHPDLYHATADGVAVRVSQGRMQTGSVIDCAGFGYDVPIEVQTRRPAEGWAPPDEVAADA